MTEESLLLLKRIVATPGVLGGKPSIDGTRVGVSHILEALAAGDTAEEIVDSLPWLTHDDIRAALIYGAYQAENTRIQAAE
ncbi:DUF433 domain-containing protein [Devosia aurantiaca]|uniref:DUF433 domain-containing protein n=1 Tax=Devosia aurantiaca TaxID=2714858 RepID=A0A6M1SHX5_9HYPH|nr:DUF433 domain-containing protein [Devosia aurantiaca]NGP16798.1 DUF433 domain-containing protein [Devosia aurantiaca]